MILLVGLEIESFRNKSGRSGRTDDLRDLIDCEPSFPITGEMDDASNKCGGAFG